MNKKARKILIIILVLAIFAGVVLPVILIAIK